ncbi:DUF1330 domain-containing protein [Halobaculum litoreum]|uniref:DUF1330 domain-containing protein n=1 Tax=Halobaculum litoreum TaxID=3031998 RepID=A0ABD5XS44_9EURY|nr:DUF1330 domain-containing protein [Halobaculum sp. DT92]
MSDEAYVIAAIDVDDWEAYRNEYLPTALERIEAHGGEVLVGTDEAEVVEGEWDANWTVVVEFPSAANARGFLSDDRYGEVVPVRHAAADSDMVLAPGFDPA